jgi:carbon monoxide dehydrogenase subunit G
MQFQGTVQFAVGQTAVWHTLTTPTLVSQCTPHLKSWSELSTNNQFQLQFSWGSGSSSVIIPLLLTWQTIIPPNRLQWQGEAQMGSTVILINGNFHLSAPTPTTTTLAFAAELDAPNKLFQQMLQTTAPRLLENFFRCLKTNIEAV